MKGHRLRLHRTQADQAHETDQADQAEATSPNAAHGRFRPDIEGLRAIAVLAVLGLHAGVPLFPGGFVGVDVFFVISGFLITGQLLRDAESPLGLRFSTFYARRVRRLLPAATIVILATLAGAALLQSPIFQERTRADARSAALFFSNLRFASGATDYFRHDQGTSLFQHFWSLSVEEQFYLIWPALILVALPGARFGAQVRRLRLTVVLGVITAISFCVSVYLTSVSIPWAFFSLASRAWELGLGAGLAVCAPFLARVPSRVRPLAAGAGVVAILLSAARYDQGMAFPGFAALAPVLGTALVVAAGTGGASGVVGRALSTRPMQLVGRYSYSLYLWHWPVLLLAATRLPTITTRWPRALVVVLFAVFPLAIVSYHLVEDPVRRWKALRNAVRPSLLLGLCLILVSLAAVPVYSRFSTGALDAGRPSPTAAAEASILTPTEYVPSDLHPTLRRAASRPGDFSPGCSAKDCVYGPVGADVAVTVIGDSHTAHLASALGRIAQEKGWRIHQLAAGSCESFLYRPSVPSCIPWREAAFRGMEANPPDLVVLSNNSFPEYDRDRKSWESGVRSAIRQLRGASRVAVVSQTPVAVEDIPSCLAVNLENTARCEPTFPSPHLTEVNERLKDIVTSEGASFIDAVPWMCTSDRCPVVAGNVLCYSDKQHMTAAFALLISDRIEVALSSLLAQ